MNLGRYNLLLIITLFAINSIDLQNILANTIRNIDHVFDGALIDQPNTTVLPTQDQEVDIKDQLDEDIPDKKIEAQHKNPPIISSIQYNHNKYNSSKNINTSSKNRNIQADYTILHNTQPKLHNVWLRSLIFPHMYCNGINNYIHAHVIWMKCPINTNLFNSFIVKYSNQQIIIDKVYTRFNNQYKSLNRSFGQQKSSSKNNLLSFDQNKTNELNAQIAKLVVASSIDPMYIEYIKNVELNCNNAYVCDFYIEFGFKN